MLFITKIAMEITFLQSTFYKEVFIFFVAFFLICTLLPRVACESFVILEINMRFE